MNKKSISTPLAKMLLAFCLGTLAAGLVAGLTIAATTIVTPADTAPNAIEKWGPANVRANATVEITTAQPRSGNGSLMFFTDTITPGQDKADFEFKWITSTHPARTLTNTTRLQFDWYRAGTSTTTAHFIPVLRLYVLDPNTSHVALLIWEGAYNGIYPTATEDQWFTQGILNDKFWMYIPSGQGIASGTVQNFNSTLNDWITGSPIGQPLDPTPINIDENTLVVGINTGVGSWWGNSFLGYVDNVEIEFNGSDSVSANFEADSENILYFPIIFKN